MVSSWWRARAGVGGAFLMSALVGPALAGSEDAADVERPRDGGVDVSLWQGPLDAASLPTELSLDDYVRLVVARNLDLKVAEVDNEVTRTNVGVARAAFDPELFGSLDGSDGETPAASVFVASASQSFDASAGFRGAIRTGASYSLSFNSSFDRQKPSNPFFDFNPSINSSVTLNLTQPLLRGAGTMIAEAGVQEARLRVRRGDLQLMDSVQNTAFNAVLAYWNLVFEQRTRDTAATALEVAKVFVERTEQRREAGTLTKLDVSRALSEEKRREEELIAAENRLGDRRDTLIALLSPGEELAAWDHTFVLTTSPRDTQVEVGGDEEAMLAALDQRFDLKALGVDLRLADLDLAVAEDSLHPQLDLRAFYGLSGLAGEFTSEGVSTGPGSNTGLFADSLDPILDSQFERWGFGLDFSYPVGNRRARESVRAARLRKERAWLQLASQRMTVVRDTRNALRGVRDAWARMQAARQARVLAEEQYDAELARLESRVTTTFEVREAQRDLFAARDTETRAVLDHEIQLAGLAQVQGRLAQGFGIDWDDEETRPGELEPGR